MKAIIVVVGVLAACVVNAQTLQSPSTPEASVVTNPDAGQAVVANPDTGTGISDQRTRQQEQTDKLMEDLNQPSTSNVMDKVQQGINRQMMRSTMPK